MLVSNAEAEPGKKDIHELLNAHSVRVSGIVWHERVEGIAEAGTANQFQGGAPHPVEHVDFGRLVLRRLLESGTQLE